MSTRKRKPTHNTGFLDERTNKARRTALSEIRETVTRWYEQCKDPLGDTMGPQAIRTFCEYVEIDTSKVMALILFWQLDGTSPGVLTRNQFVEGLVKLGCSSGPTLKKTLEDTWIDVQQNPQRYFELYRWTFDFCCEGVSKKRLDVGTALHMWDLVLPNCPHVATFTQFIKETNVKFISRDQWLCFWEFSRQHSLADYNKNEAWPILFDEFVEYSLFKHPPPSAMTFPTAYNNLTAVPTITFPAHAPPSFYPLLSPFSPSTTTEPTATTNVPNNSGSPYRPAPSLNFSPLIEFTPLFS